MGKVTYQQKYIRKATREGEKVYGPFWYAFFRENGKLKTKYLGRELPPEVIELGKNGLVTVTPVRKDLQGETVIDFDAPATELGKAFKTFLATPHLGREKVRKWVFHRLKRVGKASAEGNEIWSMFVEKCGQQGWRPPTIKATVNHYRQDGTQN